jgi:hypothetical protein
MTVSRSLGVSVLLAMLLAGCTKPDPAAAPAADAPAPAASADPAAQAPAPAPAVMMYNAYTSNALKQDGEAGEPARIFKSGEKIYAGAVLHGEASSAVIKVEWFAGDEKALGSAETTIPVKTASVATVEIAQATPLAAGTYKALVYLNDAPSWELFFEVSP